jgi:hypothetical protein
MRIDTTSLIVVHAVPRAQDSPGSAQPAGKPLFEPLNFPSAGSDVASSLVPPVRRQDGPQQPGSRLDITV